MGGSCWLVSRSGQWVLQVGESVGLVGPAGRSVGRVSGSCRLVSWSGQRVLPVGPSGQRGRSVGLVGRHWSSWWVCLGESVWPVGWAGRVCLIGQSGLLDRLGGRSVSRSVGGSSVAWPRCALCASRQHVRPGERVAARKARLGERTALRRCGARFTRRDNAGPGERVTARQWENR